MNNYRSNFERALIITEGVFSMDGDIPDIPSLISLKKKFNCWLMVDEAHSLGTIGLTGRGVSEHFNLSVNDIDILMGTLSKSLASCGGYIAGSQALIENLKYKSAGFIFSAGISPANTSAALGALRILKEQPYRVKILQDNAQLLLDELKKLNFNTGISKNTPIIPIIMKSEKETLNLSLRLNQESIFAMPIIYPAVPKDSSRVRFFISSSHLPEEIKQTVMIIKKIL